MPDNYYHLLLGIDAEIPQPDYYQLLGVSAADNLDQAGVEAAYKARMSMAQQVRSTKYKDFVEFLKGELKAARRILTDPKSRARYDKERVASAELSVRDLIVMFVQISGDLTDVEVGEILRRARLANLTDRRTQRLIDEVLKQFGHARVQAPADKLERAGRILRIRAQHAGRSADTAGDRALATAQLESSASGADAAALARDALQLERVATRRRKGALRTATRWALTGLGVLFVLGAITLVLMLQVSSLGAAIAEPIGGPGLVAVVTGTDPRADAHRRTEIERDALTDMVQAQQAEITALRGGPTPTELLDAAFRRAPETVEAMAVDLATELLGAGANTDDARLAALRDALRHWRDHLEPSLIARGLREPRWLGTAGRVDPTFAGIPGVRFERDGSLVLRVAEGDPELVVPFGPAVRGGVLAVEGTIQSGEGDLSFRWTDPRTPRPTAGTAIPGIVLAKRGSDASFFVRFWTGDTSERGFMRQVAEGTRSGRWVGRRVGAFTLRAMLALPEPLEGNVDLKSRLVAGFATERRASNRLDDLAVVNGRDSEGTGEDLVLPVAMRTELRVSPGTTLTLHAIAIE